MKRFVSIFMALLMLLGCMSFASAETEFDPELVKAAQAEGTLTVYGSCEEDYLNAACDQFAKLFGIKVERQRKSTGEVPGIISEEKGNPSADVWFGGTNNPYDTLAAEGWLDNSYVPANAEHLLSDLYKDPNGYWYGIYTGILGFMVNKDELARLKLDVPQSWDDLLKPEYKNLIWLSNYNTAGTAKLVVNLMLQMKGHDEGICMRVRPAYPQPARHRPVPAGPFLLRTGRRTGSGTCADPLRRRRCNDRSGRSASAATRHIPSGWR